MAYGEVYVEVDASVIGGGIMPMATISGGRPESVSGGETFGAWLLWRYDEQTGEGGFTGSGWYYDDPNNPISNYDSEKAFKDYLVEHRPTDLDFVLGNWDPAAKGQFYTDHQGALGTNNCLLFVSGS